MGWIKTKTISRFCPFMVHEWDKKISLFNNLPIITFFRESLI